LLTPRIQLWRAGSTGANNHVTLVIVSQSWHCSNHELMTGNLETQNNKLPAFLNGWLKKKKSSIFVQ
jgi:hypothetical protein